MAGPGPGGVTSNSAAVNAVMPSVVLPSADLGNSVSTCLVALSSAESVKSAVTSVALSTVGEEDVVAPSKAVVQGTLQNSLGFSLGPLD